MQFFPALVEQRDLKDILHTSCICAFAAPLISNANENFSPIEDVLETQLNSNEIRKLQQELEKTMTDEASELLPYYTPKN